MRYHEPHTGRACVMHRDIAYLVTRPNRDWHHTYETLWWELFHDRTGDMGSIRLLLAMGIRPKRDSHAIWLAARDGLIDILLLLLQEGSIDPMSPVHKTAAAYGRLECVHALLADPRVEPMWRSSTSCCEMGE